MISENNRDLKLIDFGGGYTDGWVSEKAANTREGELEGLEDILEAIDILQISGYLPKKGTIVRKTWYN